MIGDLSTHSAVSGPADRSTGSGPAAGKGNLEQWAAMLEPFRAGFRTEDELRAENERIFAEVLRLRGENRQDAKDAKGVPEAEAVGPEPAEGVFGVLGLEQALARVTRERDHLRKSMARLAEICGEGSDPEDDAAAARVWDFVGGFVREELLQADRIPRGEAGL